MPNDDQITMNNNKPLRSEVHAVRGIWLLRDLHGRAVSGGAALAERRYDVRPGLNLATYILFTAAASGGTSPLEFDELFRIM